MSAEEAVRSTRETHYPDASAVSVAEQRVVEPLMSLAAQQRLIEGARRGGRIGGRQPKHFTPESKERQIEGASRGGKRGGCAVKHFTPESKARQIEGARKGGSRTGKYKKQ